MNICNFKVQLQMCDLFLKENNENMQIKRIDLEYGYIINLFKEYFNHYKITLGDIDEESFLDFYDYLHYVKKIEFYLNLKILDSMKIIITEVPFIKYLLNDDEIISYAFEQQDYDFIIYILNTTNVSTKIIDNIYDMVFSMDIKKLNEKKQIEIKELSKYVNLV